MKPLGVRRGICRTVLLTPGYAIKFPSLRRYNPGGLSGRMWSFSRGVQANLAEASWSQIDGVCPALWSLGGLVNIYPRAELLSESDPEPDYKSIAPAFVPTDKKRGNVGYLKGQLVWIDYDNSWNRCPHASEIADRSKP